jgi:hypothetical protein
LLPFEMRPGLVAYECSACDYVTSVICRPVSRPAMMPFKLPPQPIDFPRGKYSGRRLGDQPKDEAEHFIRCPACRGWIDCRELAQVFEHEGPLPHPAQDQPQ